MCPKSKYFLNSLENKTKYMEGKRNYYNAMYVNYKTIESSTILINEINFSFECLKFDHT